MRNLPLAFYLFVNYYFWVSSLYGINNAKNYDKYTYLPLKSWANTVPAVSFNIV